MDISQQAAFCTEPQLQLGALLHTDLGRWEWEGPSGRRTARTAAQEPQHQTRCLEALLAGDFQHTKHNPGIPSANTRPVREQQQAQSCSQTQTREAGQFITSVRIKRWYFNFSVIHLSTLKVRSCPKNIKKMFLCRTESFIWAVGLILLPVKLMDKSQLALIGAGPGPTEGRWELLLSWGSSHSEGQETN